MLEFLKSSGPFMGMLMGLGLIIIFFVLFLASRYRRCPSDKVLVVYGKVGVGKSSRCIHGGGALVWPIIQDCAYLSLTPMTINIPLQKALSLQNIRINVPSSFTVGISTNTEIMYNAAERLLNLESRIIEDMAGEIIFGQLRLTVASLTIEQINQDRESFLESIRKNVEPELNKIGLYLINVNITDITDESNYIENIGKKAASEAINKARIDVADQEKLGAIGHSLANKEKDIRVAENQAESQKGQKKAETDRRIYVQNMEAEAVTGENTAKAGIAKTNAELAMREAEADQQAEVARRKAQVEIQKAQYAAESERLRAQEIVREEIERKKVEISAEAIAEKYRRIAKGKADATLAQYEADAAGMQKLLDSKAAGYRSLVESCNGDARSAATLLMIEKIENIVAKQVEAIQNLKIDKITVWDSGNGKNGSSSTSNFLSSMVQSLPPLHDIAGMAGVELPEYLGKMAEEKTKGAPTRAAKPEGSSEQMEENPAE
ncbi:MAG: flotillin family protein [Candidatus Sumerlaeia bacterium]